MSDQAYRTRPFDQAETWHTSELTIEQFHAVEYAVDAITPFSEHRHPEHQLAWMREGTMELRLGSTTWHLHRAHLVWIPGNVVHQMTLMNPGRMVTAYADPDVRPVGPRWSHPHVFEIDELASGLLLHLTGKDIDDRRRHRCTHLLYDILASAPERHDVLALPGKGIAGVIAERIVADPALTLTVEGWAAELGVSTKTVMRAFVTDTGTTFGQWRTRARMYASLNLLSAGAAISEVAAEVGYRTTSGYIDAFKSEFGVTPGRYGDRSLSGVNN